MQLRVLVIDDEPDICQLIAELLHQTGYQVTTAVDGDAGLAHLRAERFDMVILDIMLPGRDGWDVCRLIKGHPLTQYLPVLLLTGRIHPLDRFLSFEVAHADDYLLKPFDCAELVAIVDRLTTRVSPVHRARGGREYPW
jgi:DNA-binding response OmpR family regulator